MVRRMVCVVSCMVYVIVYICSASHAVCSMLRALRAVVCVYMCMVELHTTRIMQHATHNVYNTDSMS